VPGTNSVSAIVGAVRSVESESGVKLTSVSLDVKEWHTLVERDLNTSKVDYVLRGGFLDIKVDGRWVSISQSHMIRAVL
jgi:hypothetical protein